MGKNNRNKQSQIPTPSQKAKVEEKSENKVDATLSSGNYGSSSVAIDIVAESKQDSSEGMISHTHDNNLSHLLEENFELKQTISALKHELSEKDYALLQKTTDLALMLTFVEEIDSHIHVSVTEVHNTETATVVEDVEVDITTIHAKRMFTLISMLTNMKAQMKLHSDELTKVVADNELLQSELQTSQSRLAHLAHAYKKDHSSYQSEINKLEEEKMSMYEKLKLALEHSLDEIEDFRTELRNTVMQLDASYAALASMEKAHAIELDSLKHATDEAQSAWHSKELNYFAELALLKSTIEKLETDKTATVHKLTAGFEQSQENLFEAYNQLNQSMEESVLNMSRRSREFNENIVAEWPDKEQEYMNEIEQLKQNLNDSNVAWQEKVDQLEAEKSLVLEKFETELDLLNNSTFSFGETIDHFMVDEEEWQDKEQQYKEQIETLKQEIVEYGDHSMIVERERDALQSERDSLQLKVDELLEQLKDSSGDTDSEVDILRKKLLTIQTNSMQLITELTNSKNSLQVQLSNLEAEHEKVVEQLETSRLDSQNENNSSNSDEISLLKDRENQLLKEIESLQREMIDCGEYSITVEKERDALQNENLSLQLKVDDLLLQLKEGETYHHSKIDALNSTLEETSTDLKEQKELVEQLKESLLTVQSNSVNLITELTNSENNLHAQLSKLEADHEVVVSQLQGELLTALTDLKNINSAHSEAEAEWKIKENNLLSDIEIVKQEMIDCSDYYTAVEKERNALKAEQQNVQLRVNEVSQKLAEVEFSCEAKITKLQSELSALVAVKTTLESSLSTEEKKLTSMQSLYQQALTDLKSCREVEERVKLELEEVIDSSKKNVSSLEKDNHDLHHKLNEISALNKDLSHQLNDTKNSNKSIITKLNSHIVELENGLIRCETLQASKIEELKALTDSQQHQIVTLTKERSEFEELKLNSEHEYQLELQKLHDQLSECQQNLDKSEQLLQQSQSHEATSTVSIEEYNKVVVRLRETIASEEKIHKELETLREEYLNEVDRSTAVLNDSFVEIADEAEEIIALRNELMTATATWNDKELQLFNELEELRGKLQSQSMSESDLETTLSALRSREQELMAANETLHNQVVSLTSEMDDSVKAKDAAKLKVVEVEKVLTQIKDLYQKSLNELKNSKENAETEALRFAQLTATNVEKQSELQSLCLNLQKELQTVAESLKSTTEDLNTTKSQLTEAEEHVKHLRLELTAIEKEKSKLQKNFESEGRKREQDTERSLSSVNDLLLACRHQLQELQLSHDESNKTIDDQKKEISKLSTLLTSQQSQVDALQNEKSVIENSWRNDVQEYQAENERVNGELAHYVEKIRSLEDSNRDLLTFKDEARKVAADNEAEWHHKIHHYDEIIAALKEEMVECGDYSIEVEKERDSLQGERDSLQLKVDELLEKMRDNSINSNNLLAQITKLQISSKAELDQVYVELATTTESLKQSVTIHENEVAVWKNKEEHLSKEVSRLKQELSSVTQSNGTLEKKSSNLHQLYQQSLQTVKELNETVNVIKTNEQTTADNLKEIHDLKHKCHELEHKNEEISASLRELIESHNIANESNALVIRNLEHQLKDQEENHHTELSKLNTLLSASANNIENVTEELNESRASVTRLHKEIHHLEQTHKSECSTLEAQHENTKLQLSDALQQCEHISSDLHVANDALIDLSSKIAALQYRGTQDAEVLEQLNLSESTITTLRNNLIQVEDMYSEELRKKKELESDVEELQRQNAELVTELTEVNDSMEEFSNEIEAMKNKLLAENNSVKLLTQEKEQLVELLEKLKEESTVEKQDISGQLAAITSAHLESVAEYMKRITELEAATAKHESVHAAHLAEFSATLNTATTTIAQLNKDLGAEKKNCEDLQMKLKLSDDRYTVEVDKMVSKLQALKDVGDKAVTEHKKELQKCEDKWKSICETTDKKLSVSLAAANKTIEELRDELRILNKRIGTANNEATEKISTLESEIEQLLTKNKEVSVSYDILNNELTSLQTAKQNLENNCSTLQSQIIELEKQLKVATNGKQSNKADKEALNKEITRLSTENNNLTVKINELAFKLHNVHHDVEKAAKNHKHELEISESKWKTEYDTAEKNFANNMTAANKTIHDLQEENHLLNIKVKQLTVEVEAFKVTELQSSEIAIKWKQSSDKNDDLQRLIDAMKAKLVIESEKLKECNNSLKEAKLTLLQQTDLLSAEKLTNENLHHKLHEVESKYVHEISHLNHSIEHLKHQNEKLLEEHHHALSAAEEKHSTTREEFNENFVALSEANDTIEELRDEIKSLKQKLFTGDKELASEIHKLMRDNKELSTQYNESKEALNSVNEELKILTELHENVKFECIANVERYQNAEVEVKRLEVHMIEIQNQLLTSHKSVAELQHELKTRETELLSDTETLTDDILKLTDQLQILRSENVKLTTETSTLHSKLHKESDALRVMEHQYAKLEKEYADLWKERSTATSKIEELQSEWTAIQSTHVAEKKTILHDNERLTKELELITKEVTILKQERSSVVEQSADELEFLRKEHTILQSKFAHIESLNHDLQHQLSNQENTHNEAITKQTQRITELFDVINHLRDEKDAMQIEHSNTCVKYEEDLQYSERELITAMEDLKVSNRSLGEACMKLSDAEEQLRNLQNDNTALEEEIHNMRESYQRSIGEQNEQSISEQNEIEATRKEFHELQHKFSELFILVGKTQEELKLSSLENQQVWEKLNAANQIISDLRSENREHYQSEHSSVNIEELQKENLDLRNNFTELSEFHSARILECNNRIKELQELLGDADSMYSREIADLSTALSEARTQIDDYDVARKTIEELKAKLKDMERKHTMEVSHLVGTMKNVAVDVDKQTSTLSRTQDKLKASRAESKQAYTDLAAAQETIEMLRNELMNSKDASYVKNTKVEVKALRHENREAWTSLNEANETIAELQHELKTLQTKMWKMKSWS